MIREDPRARQNPHLFWFRKQYTNFQVRIPQRGQPFSNGSTAMQADFRAPRRRARVYEELEAPLPVIRSAGEKCVYRAELINQHVLVCHPDHVRKIHNQVRVASSDSLTAKQSCKMLLKRSSVDYRI